MGINRRYFLKLTSFLALRWPLQELPKLSPVHQQATQSYGSTAYGMGVYGAGAYGGHPGQTAEKTKIYVPNVSRGE